jgi:hypothetical protein
MDGRVGQLVGSGRFTSPRFLPKDPSTYRYVPDAWWTAAWRAGERSVTLRGPGRLPPGAGFGAGRPAFFPPDRTESGRNHLPGEHRRPPIPHKSRPAIISGRPGTGHVNRPVGATRCPGYLRQRFSCSAPSEPTVQRPQARWSSWPRAVRGPGGERRASDDFRHRRPTETQRPAATSNSSPAAGQA